MEKSSPGHSILYGHGVYRPRTNELPDIPLPFYMRSLGRRAVNADYTESVAADVKNFVQIFWGIRGEGVFLLEDGASTILKENMVFYRLPNQAHELYSISRHWEYYWLAFDGPCAEVMMCSYHYPVEAFEAGACPYGLFSELETLLLDMSPYCWRRGTAVISDILAHAGGRHDVSTREGRLVKEFIRLCRENFRNETVNINVLADMLSVDRSTLRRAVQKQINISPLGYLVRLRVQEALSLLRESDLPVCEVALRSGIPDSSYFCKTIRRETGLTPAEFRNQER